MNEIKDVSRLAANEWKMTQDSWTLKSNGKIKEAKALSKADRRLFIDNLMWLLKQTRIGLESYEYDDERDEIEIVTNSGATTTAYIAMDSYLAIIKDVVRVF